MLDNMKKLLLVALLFSFNAHADTVAWLENQSGGKIVLTDATCPDDPRQFTAYGTSPSISTQFGCWFSDDMMVHITWSKSGNFKSYPLELWNVNDNVAKKLRRKNQDSSGRKSI